MLLDGKGGRSSMDNMSFLNNKKLSRSRSLNFSSPVVCLGALYLLSTLFFGYAVLTFVVPSTDTVEEKRREMMDLDMSYEDCIQNNLQIDFEQKISPNIDLRNKKHDLFRDIQKFQKNLGYGQTLPDLLAMKSTNSGDGGRKPTVTVILNHFQRNTLCHQIRAILDQTYQATQIWVLAFGSPIEEQLRAIAATANDSRIHFMSSSYNLAYFGRFQVALQAATDYVYFLDDDMIPGQRVIEIIMHVAGIPQFQKSVFGSIGRILPFHDKRLQNFPSYRAIKKEAGLYFPDPAYGLAVQELLEVDFLCSSWFLQTQVVKVLFRDPPATFATGEDLHLSFQIQKYYDGHSLVVPVDSEDPDTWADQEHRLAYLQETTLANKMNVVLRDNQWWSALKAGFVTQWAKMHAAKMGSLFIFLSSLEDAVAFKPLYKSLTTTSGGQRGPVFVVVAGGVACPCEKAAEVLGMAPEACTERKLKILDLNLGASHPWVDVRGGAASDAFYSFRGLFRSFQPRTFLFSSGLPPALESEIRSAAEEILAKNTTTLVQLPVESLPDMAWVAHLSPEGLAAWNRPHISIAVITMNRPESLERLLGSMNAARPLGRPITVIFNVDSRADAKTLKIVNAFEWKFGPKVVRRRIVQAGLLKSVAESWSPRDDDDYGLMLEDDIEVSPYFLQWLHYSLLMYRYDPANVVPRLTSIALFSPRIIEIIPNRPRWNGQDNLTWAPPNSPYLHQLPCSWGSLFLPERWREFQHYIYSRHNWSDVPKIAPVQIRHSMTNGWRGSWKKFFIDMMWIRGYLTLYPNFPDQAALSTNHLERGEHIEAAKYYKLNHSRNDFEIPLLMENFVPLLPEGRLPPLNELPILDLFNRRSNFEWLIRNGAAQGMDVLDCEPDEEEVNIDPITGIEQGCRALVIPDVKTMYAGNETASSHR